jgi:formylglycine-generating enzyme required for sulfatase activity
LVDNNPEADASARRVVRGGAWGDDRDLVRAAYRNFNSPSHRKNPFIDDRDLVRAAYRNRYTPDDRYFYLGFRVVVSVAPQKGF